jgi:hypothetical protein
MPPGDYWLKDEPIPSVSEVVAQMKSSYRSHQIEEGARLGSVVHRLIERSLLGETIGPDEVPEDAANAWAAWCAWSFHREPTIVRIPTPDGDKPASEVALTWATDPRLAYGGRIDLVAVVNGRRTIIDFKTRTAGDGALPSADRHSYTQIGGYTQLWAVNHGRADSALILILGRDKPVFRECWLSPPMITYSETEFIALRTAYNAHETRKKLAMDLRAEQERGES